MYAKRLMVNVGCKEAGGGGGGKTLPKGHKNRGGGGGGEGGGGGGGGGNHALGALEDRLWTWEGERTQDFGPD